MNKIIIMGRVGKDPEIKYYNREGEESFATASFSVAVDRPKRKSEDEAVTDWIPCKALGKRAEFIEKYVKKGGKFLIEGRMQIDTWQDEDGSNKHFTYILVTGIEFCESKNSDAASSNTEAKPVTDEHGFMNIPTGIEDELPFV